MGCRLPAMRGIVRAMSDKKTALVTGGNKGIGYEIVRQLLAKGFQVFLTARNTVAGKKAAANLQGDVQFLPMDVSDDKAIENAARTYGERSSVLDVLINNAAIYPDEGLVSPVTSPATVCRN